ncbi:acetamidase/formamidase family protein [Bacillus sp. JCM 19041]|uniref:acetamidase/formamidase family protein n=1 Tax=Bacillus sp. JCM 19041 TaxID=1460637 RepID=UPI000A7F48C2
MTVHHLKPARHTLHNFFSREMKPALTIESGDTVLCKTLDSAWGKEQRAELGAARIRWTDVDEERMAPHFGHALLGPIAIKEAKQGDTLEVTINEIIPGEWGWASGGGFPSECNKQLSIENEPEAMLDFLLDRDKMEAKSQFGNFNHKVKLAPFMGIMGMPPNKSGAHTTFVPRNCGGNIDCNLLQAGSTLYLPISVDEAFFSIGDGHAVQGDGEVSGPALECPMDRVNVTLNVRKDIEVKRHGHKRKKGLLQWHLIKTLMRQCGLL